MEYDDWLCKCVDNRISLAMKITSDILAMNTNTQPIPETEFKVGISDIGEFTVDSTSRFSSLSVLFISIKFFC
jgi:hypothetical protein